MVKIPKVEWKWEHNLPNTLLKIQGDQSEKLLGKSAYINNLNDLN
jgi:hypothetical protein